MRLIDADEIEKFLNNAIQIQEDMSKEMGIEKDDFVQGELKGYRDILNGIKEQPTVKTRKELAKDAVVTDNPQTNIEVMMNLSYNGEDGQVWIRGGGADGEDCTLIDFSRQMCMKNQECQFDDGFPSDLGKNDFDQIGDLFMECSMCGCPIGTAYFIAIQAAELRERLRKYEDRDIEAEPVKDQHSRTGIGYEYHDWLCPSCGEFIAFEPEINGIPRRCQSCGQLLKKRGR